MGAFKHPGCSFILAWFAEIEGPLGCLSMWCTGVWFLVFGFLVIKCTGFYVVYGFLPWMFGFFMVHGCFGMYGSESFLCHPPTPTIRGTKRSYHLQLLLFPWRYAKIACLYKNMTNRSGKCNLNIKQRGNMTLKSFFTTLFDSYVNFNNKQDQNWKIKCNLIVIFSTFPFRYWIKYNTKTMFSYCFVTQLVDFHSALPTKLMRNQGPTNPCQITKLQFP